MQDVFSDIRNLLKISSTKIDNNIFKLHYKATMFMLAAFSLLIMSKQYFGDPIDCISTNVDTGDFLDFYCWIHSTFHYPNLTKGEVGKHVPHPGIGNNVVDHNTDERHEARYHSYYQWVTFFLYFQALLFYMPHYLWKMWEGGKVKMLTKDLDTPIIDDEAKEDRKELLIKYFKLNLNQHNFYVGKFIFCEVLNFINVILQIYFTDCFLGYSFTTYGSEVIAYMKNPDAAFNPTEVVFPKVTKCTFHKSGAGGTFESHDVLCVLPLNILNEKIFMVLWFWYILVAVVTGVSLLYRASTFMPYVRQLVLRVRSRLSSSVTVEVVARKCQLGDWFLLYLLAKNIDPVIYKEFLDELGRDLQQLGKST